MEAFITVFQHCDWKQCTLVWQLVGSLLGISVHLLPPEMCRTLSAALPEAVCLIDKSLTDLSIALRFVTLQNKHECIQYLSAFSAGGDLLKLPIRSASVPPLAGLLDGF